jgi:hypothetical protein
LTHFGSLMGHISTIKNSDGYFKIGYSYIS